MGEVVTLSADALGSLLAPLRSSRPRLAALASDLQQALNNSEGKGTFSIPDIPDTCGVDLRGARRALGHNAKSATICGSVERIRNPPKPRRLHPPIFQVEGRFLSLPSGRHEQKGQVRRGFDRG